MEKPVAGSLICLKCLNSHGKYLFGKGISYRVFKATKNKLFASNEKQIDNCTLMLDMPHSYMSVVYTYHCRGVFKNIFLVWKSACACVFNI